MSAPLSSWLLAYTCCREGSAIVDHENAEEDGRALIVQTTKVQVARIFPHACCHDDQAIPISEDVKAEDRNRLFFVDPQRLSVARRASDTADHQPETGKIVAEERRNYERRLAYAGDDGICKIVEEAPLCVKQDASLILAAVKREPLALQFADDVVRADRDVVLASVRRCGDAFSFASDNLKRERDFVMHIVGMQSGTLKYACAELQADPQIQEEAETTSYPERVSNADNGAAVSMLVRDAPERWRTDLQLALLAVKKCGGALQHVPESLRDDKEVVFAAVRQDGNALAFASEGLRADKAIVLAAVRTSPAAIKFAKDPFNQDYDCLKAAGLWQDYSSKSRKWQAILSVKYMRDEKSTEYSMHYHQAFKSDPILSRFRSSFALAWYPFSCRSPDFTKFAKTCTGTHSVDSDQTDKDSPIGIFVQAQENSGLSNKQSLEAEFATKAGLKISRTCTNLDDFYKAGFERLGHAVSAWIESGYANMDQETVFIGSQEWWAPPSKTGGSGSARGGSGRNGSGSPPQTRSRLRQQRQKMHSLSLDIEVV